MSPSDERRSVAPQASSPAEIDAFVAAARGTAVTARGSGSGRLIFALDATMSRQPTWDLATGLQVQMFDVAARLGGLAVQLVYFRGLNECRASPFIDGGAGLAKFMRRIRVESGNTQIGRVLAHAADEARAARVAALVFVGDACEERLGPLVTRAGELALLGVKTFMFHEGDDPAAGRAFREIARLTGGAYARFDADAAERLAALLRAAATYAAGGLDALEAQEGRDAAAKLLLAQMR